MMITIQLTENLCWHHNPKRFELMVKEARTVTEIIDLIGVKAHEKIKVKVNGRSVSGSFVVSEGDVIEISSP